MSLAVPAGCAGTPDISTSPVSPPVRTPVLTTTPVTAVPPSQPPQGAPAPEGSQSPLPQGANAGPYPGIYDASAAAAATYRLWLNYEMDSETDLARGFESDSYPDGVSVCAQLALNTPLESIERKLSETKGWSVTGAVAIVKGALNALCPRYNQGYKTGFDRTVDSVSAVLARGVTWSGVAPGIYETGYFIKEACGYLKKLGTADGLEVHLHSFRLNAPNQTAPAAAFIQRVADDVQLRRATNHAVFAGCLGHHRLLNAYWTMA
ncbi:MAG: hypothetical protein IT193_12360 [Propionibacteriaceae bacterium]|nr:hypothetical protein [Propionibacteriaceae bacterium]